MAVLAVLAAVVQVRVGFHKVVPVAVIPAVAAAVADQVVLLVMVFMVAPVVAV
jgi:hypothetical protein